MWLSSPWDANADANIDPKSIIYQHALGKSLKFWKFLKHFSRERSFCGLGNLIKQNRSLGRRNFVPPFGFTFTLNLKSVNPNGPWKGVLLYGNHPGERGLGIWMYQHNPHHGLFNTSLFISVFGS